MKITRRRFLRFSALATGLGAGAGLYAWQWEPHWVQIVERRLPLLNLPNRLRGKRLVQLSDLHIGPQVDDSYLMHTFDRVRRLAPEIVVYTGDFTSHCVEVLPHARRMFPHLPLGSKATLGILGNHDYGINWSQPELADEIATIAKDAGVTILRNAAQDLDELQIVGMDDLWGNRFEPERALKGLAGNKASLVLSHNPDTADLPGWGNYEGWILSGHTHGGQCKPPFLPPPLLPVKNKRYVSGEYSLSGGRRMYINRGLGHLMPVRFNVRPEVTLFVLESA